jgi:hypothetical protein
MAAIFSVGLSESQGCETLRIVQDIVDSGYGNAATPYPRQRRFRTIIECEQRGVS